jgi:hypothetical protein
MGEHVGIGNPDHSKKTRPWSFGHVHVDAEHHLAWLIIMEVCTRKLCTCVRTVSLEIGQGNDF